MNSPKVTVCIPVYNGAAFLAQAIESVLAQTLTDFELIVLDNASTDNTPEILKRYHDPRMRVIRHASNVGAVENFNASLREARGEWVKILCADDLLYPECLERQLGVLSGDSGLDTVLICCARDIISESGRKWMRRGYFKRSRRVDGRIAIRCSVRAGTTVFGEPSAVLMHRETAVRAGGFDPRRRYSVDLDLWTRILQQGSLYAVKDALCAFRISSGSWSMALVHSQAREFIDWMRACREDKTLGITVGDMVMGWIKANLLMWQRFMFYRLLLGASKTTRDGKDNS